LVVVVIDVSHPLVSTPDESQLRYPAEHPEYWHLPPVHADGVE
jgi:hypothetical protein